MQLTAIHGDFTEPPTTIGADPDDPSRTDRLPDGALQAYCYVKGPQTHTRTALLQARCVEGHSTDPAWLTETMLAETRAETED